MDLDTPVDQNGGGGDDDGTTSSMRRTSLGGSSGLVRLQSRIAVDGIRGGSREKKRGCISAAATPRSRVLG